jgi:hypothetical protein
MLAVSTLNTAAPARGSSLSNPNPPTGHPALHLCVAQLWPLRRMRTTHTLPCSNRRARRGRCPRCRWRSPVDGSARVAVMRGSMRGRPTPAPAPPRLRTMRRLACVLTFGGRVGGAEAHRLTGSESTSYATFTSRNLSAALGSSRFLSGCSLRHSLRYTFLSSASSTPASTPSTL